MTTDKPSATRASTSKASGATVPSDKTTSTSSSSSSKPTRGRFPIDAAEVLQKLLEMGYYLGDSEITDKVEWLIGGRGDQLTKKGTSDTDPEEAVLSVVGEVAVDNCWLGALGGWQPKNTFSEPITKARARFVLKPVEREPGLFSFRDDFLKYRSKINALEKLAWAGKTDGKTVVQSCLGDVGLTLTHHFFEERVKTSSDDPEPEAKGEDTETVAASPAPLSTDDEKDIFSFENWPVSKESRELMDAIKDTHEVMPMPAFDMENKPIPPAEYESRLKGAIVEAHFALTSWAFGKSKVLSIANIREVLVLVAPMPAARSPMKKRNIRDGPATSPKKARRS